MGLFCLHMLTFTACLSVCLFVSNVKTAEPIEPKFYVGPHMTPGKVLDAPNYKDLCPNVFDFCKDFRIREKVLLDPRTFFVIIIHI